MMDQGAEPALRNRKLVEEKDVEDALDFLLKGAVELGEARRKLVLAERMRSHVEALEMKMHAEKSVSAQSREARASKRYLECIEEEAKAAGDYEVQKAKREAMDARLRVFQTESANYRGIRI